MFLGLRCSLILLRCTLLLQQIQNLFDYKGFVTLNCQMHSPHERPTPLVRWEVVTTIHQRLILPGSGETPKVVTYFWRREECYSANIAVPNTKGMDTQTGITTRQVELGQHTKVRLNESNSLYEGGDPLIQVSRRSQEPPLLNQLYSLCSIQAEQVIISLLRCTIHKRLHRGLLSCTPYKVSDSE